jgi:hypothetical protein
MERNDLVLYLDIPEFSEALHASKWRTDIVLPQAGDNICPENLLSEKTLAMLETVSAGGRFRITADEQTNGEQRREALQDA